MFAVITLPFTIAISAISAVISFVTDPLGFLASIAVIGGIIVGLVWWFERM